MVKYIVTVDLIPTPDNTHYTGCKLSYMYGIHNTTENRANNYPVEEFAKRYGYSRKCDAVRRMNYHMKLKELYWDATYTLLEVDVS